MTVFTDGPGELYIRAHYAADGTPERIEVLTAPQSTSWRCFEVLRDIAPDYRDPHDAEVLALPGVRYRIGELHPDPRRASHGDRMLYRIDDDRPTGVRADEHESHTRPDRPA